MHGFSKKNLAFGIGFDYCNNTNKCSAVAEMGDSLATVDMGQKEGPVMPLSRGGAGSPSNIVALAEAYIRTKRHLDTSRRLASTDMGQKLGACASLPVGAGSNTVTQGQAGLASFRQHRFKPS